ncbi:hypothetical protein TNCV_5127021 [Trichonephila clavipes]|nr:hypothetical protein TNCV_5127021 [Trichonephila clavipes]
MGVGDEQQVAEGLYVSLSNPSTLKSELSAPRACKVEGEEVTKNPARQHLGQSPRVEPSVQMKPPGGKRVWIVSKAIA